jgi:crossover junction endodeoxyribonuclease RuvC
MSGEFILGFDPGLSGAVAILDQHGHLVDVIDMPTVEVKVGTSTKRQVAPAALSAELYMFRDAFAYVEKVNAMPGQGVSSMFSLGRSMGVIEGVLAGLSVPYTMIRPAEWTKAMRLAEGKDGSRQRAMELFPNRADLFKRAKDDGRADAVLIAAYGKGLHHG